MKHFGETYPKMIMLCTFYKVVDLSADFTFHFFKFFYFISSTTYIQKRSLFTISLLDLCTAFPHVVCYFAKLSFPIQFCYKPNGPHNWGTLCWSPRTVVILPRKTQLFGLFLEQQTNCICFSASAVKCQTQSGGYG